MSFDKESILVAKADGNVIVNKKFTKNILSWKDFSDIFDLAYIKNGIRFASFGTCTIDKSEQYTNIFDKLVDEISNIHPGKKISVLSIVHFITRNNNDLDDALGKSFKENFLSKNPEKMPNVLPPREAFEPTVHADPVDGFFIQFQGSTLWNIYYESNIEEHILFPGDSIFIPKGLRHSVESLCPRNAVSISFSE